MEDELDIRPVARGELFDPELHDAVERYGLAGGIRVLMHRRYVEILERDFLNPVVPGADNTLAVIDLPSSSREG